MINNILKIPIILGSFVLIIFGVFHCFWPKIFKWNNYSASTSTVFFDTILTINFYMSINVIVLGLMNLTISLFFWNNIELIIIFLFVQSILILIRFIYGIIKPIRIPKKGVYPIFLFFFIFTFFLFSIPLILIIFNVL